MYTLTVSEDEENFQRFQASTVAHDRDSGIH